VQVQLEVDSSGCGTGSLHGGNRLPGFKRQTEDSIPCLLVASRRGRKGNIAPKASASAGEISLRWSLAYTVSKDAYAFYF
jgi:hypothetical protein